MPNWGTFQGHQVNPAAMPSPVSNNHFQNPNRATMQGINGGNPMLKGGGGSGQQPPIGGTPNPASANALAQQQRQIAMQSPAMQRLNNFQRGGMLDQGQQAQYLNFMSGGRAGAGMGHPTEFANQMTQNPAVQGRMNQHMQGLGVQGVRSTYGNVADAPTSQWADSAAGRTYQAQQAAGDTWGQPQNAYSQMIQNATARQPYAAPMVARRNEILNAGQQMPIPSYHNVNQPMQPVQNTMYNSNYGRPVSKNFQGASSPYQNAYNQTNAFRG